MSPEIIIFILTNFATAYIFYKMGLEHGVHHFLKHRMNSIVDSIFSTVAAEFYPDDPNGKRKVSDRMMRRSFLDLLDLVSERRS